MDSFYPENRSSTVGKIESTAGAVPIRNEKGEVSMQKVKVSRYISGKRPDYAPDSSDESSDEDGFVRAPRLPAGGRGRQGRRSRPVGEEEDEDMDEDGDNEEEEEEKEDVEPELDSIADRRLRRILQAKAEIRSEMEAADRVAARRRRRVEDPQILAEGVDEDAEEEEGEVEEEEEEEELPAPPTRRRIHDSEESSDAEEELSDEEISRRRDLIRLKVRQKERQEEILLDDGGARPGEEHGDEDGDEDSESEYEEYTESEDDDEDEVAGPRLKPVFVRRKDRVTIQEKEKEVEKQRHLEAEEKRMAEERRKESVRIVESAIRTERQQEGAKDNKQQNVADVDTDDDAPEAEYELWKARELKRIKRDKEIREELEKERLEIDRIRNLTEEERRTELRNNPKVVTNKALKGKYKFLQKYYHRGVFYLDKDDEVLKQDFAQPTLEDHFNKTVLPKVMQVKNFGRSGRTKYTHLVDQDTTQFDSPWTQTDNQVNYKFGANIAGGMKQNFDKPTGSRKKNKSVV